MIIPTIMLTVRILMRKVHELLLLVLHLILKDFILLQMERPPIQKVNIILLQDTLLIRKVIPLQLLEIHLIPRGLIHNH